jgi:AraC-like DNA-binding protein
LASSSFADVRIPSDSRRVQKIEDEICRNYNKQLYLDDLADMVGMTPTAFSRFFKLRTGRTLSEYIIDIRLGHAARKLVDTTMTIAEICYDCGFNNISNFNRIFKKRKGCSPTTFRENYLKTKLIV